MTSSSEQTTALNPYTNTRALLHPGVVHQFGEALAGAMMPWLSMAWENGRTAASPRVVSTVAELDALGGNSVLYSQAAWAVLRKQSHGTDWITDHASHSKHMLTASEVLEWVQDWQLLRVGGTE